MIAGSTLSHDAVTAIVDGKRVLGPAREIREVKNANRAYGLVEELDPSSLADLLRAHGVMMDGLIDDAGRFRDALLPYTATVARLGADDRTDRALTFLAAHPAVTVTDPADHLGCSRRTAERVIATLRASGGLVREGSARAGRWKVADLSGEPPTGEGGGRRPQDSAVPGGPSANRTRA